MDVRRELLKLKYKQINKKWNEGNLSHNMEIFKAIEDKIRGKKR